MARTVNLGNVIGPQGPKGDTGAAGKAGSKWGKVDTNLGSDTQAPEGYVTGDWLVDSAYDIYQVSEKGTLTLKGNIKGANGAKGDKGDTGAKGAQGEIGPTGPKGETGVQGEQGPQGVQGDKGEKGDKGDKGDAFSIAKTYASVEAMNADFSGTDVKEGQFVMIDTGNVNDEDNAKLYVKGAKAFTYITDLSGATGLTGPQGPKGETGATGAQGEQGIQGVKGEKGDTGATGATGADGKTPEFSIDESGNLIATYPD